MLGPGGAVRSPFYALTPRIYPLLAAGNDADTPFHEAQDEKFVQVPHAVCTAVCVGPWCSWWLWALML